jgi:hypothetical protein
MHLLRWNLLVPQELLLTREDHGSLDLGRTATRAEQTQHLGHGITELVCFSGGALTMLN